MERRVINILLLMVTIVTLRNVIEMWQTMTQNGAGELVLKQRICDKQINTEGLITSSQWLADQKVHNTDFFLNQHYYQLRAAI